MSASIRGSHLNGLWTFDYSDESVWQIRLDYAVTLVTEHTTVRIERDFEVHVGSQVRSVVPNSPDHVASVAALHQIPLLRAAISDGGGLRMDFADSSQVVVPPSDDAYEAFDYMIVGGWKFVSTPGGGLSYWTPDEVDGDVVEFRFNV